MQKTLIIILLALVLGSLLGAFIHKKFAKPAPKDIAVFQEIIKQRELHLIKHLYQDVCFIHRKNDTSKAIKAITIIPVSLSAYIDLKKLEIKMKGDSVKSIMLPSPEIGDPNYRVDSMQVIQVKSSFIHIGKDLYTEVTEQIQNIVQLRKEAILETSVKYDIIGQTKNEALEYISSLLKSLNMSHVQVSFADQGSPPNNLASIEPVFIPVEYNFEE